MSTASTTFKSLLVANRGEIACRVMRTAKALGLRTVAVYSEADAQAPHVKMADDVFLLGPAPVGDSYLNLDRVMAAIAATGAQSVHPGYGFLSENAGFAEACENARVTFIGPPIAAIDLMGDKAKSKRRMIDAGVPCVPGYQGEDQGDATLIAAAKDIGFPIMVKAAAGGGGRGMRLVQDAKDLPDAITAARSEAINAFGSGDLILERAIIEPRHVEIQVFADSHGNVIHLGERDCSVQRRHQKVLEEAPCPVMTPGLRAKMGAAAVKAAQDINYVGAGTVEFLLDSNGDFYFLEMNTRLQVEHPVTEMVTGLDLVAMQIRVAQGEPLGIIQDDVNLSGHAIEARLYAEDVAAGFLPATGPIDLWKPASGKGIRIDSGIATGGEVSPFYDPMIAKVIAHGNSREEARRKLVGALEATSLFGVVTNKQFLIEALDKPAFISGAATTAFIAENFGVEELKAGEIEPADAAFGAVLLYELAHDRALAKSISVARQLAGWASATPITTPFAFLSGEARAEASVTPSGRNNYQVICGDRTMAVSVQARDGNEALLEIDGDRQKVTFNQPVSDVEGARIQLSISGRTLDLVNVNAVVAKVSEAAGAGAVFAPMHGMLLDVLVKPGQKVSKGDRLAIVEAMKMQHELIAEIDGAVSAVYFEAGTQVAAKALLFEIEISGED